MISVRPILLPEGHGRFAYAFYATNDTYAVAVLVAIKELLRHGVGAGIDVVVLHLGVSGYLLRRIRGMGVLLCRVEPLRHVSGDYYRDCLVKLRIFQLTQYERIVYFDADSLPLQTLDPLFFEPFDEPLAAPDAYWVPHPQITSALLVVKPRLESFARCVKHFSEAAQKQIYDLEILDVEFRGEVHPLSRDFFALNSEWEADDGRYCLGEPRARFQTCRLIHFTAVGKPWSHSPADLRRNFPTLHPLFHESWERWWLVRDELIQTASFFSRSKYLRLKNNPHERGRGSMDP